MTVVRGDRRGFLRSALLFALVVPLGAACRRSASESKSFADVGSGWVDPWRAIFDSEDARQLGLQVVLDAPASIEHARSQLGRWDRAADPIDQLNTACQKDLSTGTTSTVGGWQVPTTLAGLLGALSG